MSNNQGDENKSLPERMVKVETKIEGIETDMTEIKNDLSSLKDNQAETNSDIRELNILLKDGFDSFKEIVKQNSNVISEMGKKLDESNKINDARYIELKSKPDTFKNFLVRIGEGILILSISGGLFYAILSKITPIIKL